MQRLFEILQKNRTFLRHRYQLVKKRTCYVVVANALFITVCKRSLYSAIEDRNQALPLIE